MGIDINRAHGLYSRLWGNLVRVTDTGKKSFCLKSNHFSMGPLPKEGQKKLTKFQEKTATMTYVYGTSFYWIDVQSHVILIFLLPLHCPALHHGNSATIFE